MKLKCATEIRHLGEAATPVTRRGGGPCPIFATYYTLAFALQLRKIMENLSQGIQKVLGLSAPGTFF
jgi:hypothetical protein